METKLMITFDDGQAGQQLIAKLSKKYAEPSMINKDVIAWENPSRDLINAIVDQVLDGNIVINMSIVKD